MDVLIQLGGIALVVLASRLALAGVCCLQRRRALAGESARKLLHLAMGLLALSYPWLFADLWPVLVLSGLYVGLLIFATICQPLRYRLAHVVYAVDRPSLGEFYFPLACAGLFALAAGDALLYCIPVLLLTVADAAAAVVGRAYGRHLFAAPGGRKSVEGSVAFFTVAFFLVHVPLLLWADMAPPAVLAASLAVAALATVLEALATRGLDNVLVPLGSFVVLWWMLGAI
jgi:phytol kinase